MGQHWAHVSSCGINRVFQALSRHQGSGRAREPCRAWRQAHGAAGPVHSINLSCLGVWHMCERPALVTVTAVEV